MLLTMAEGGILRFLVLVVCLIFPFKTQSSTVPLPYPSRQIAGISVIDTPLIHAAEQYALIHSTHAVYKHLMRSWLYGVLLINANEDLRDVDLEVHAVSCLLHDLGWDNAKNSTIVSPDRRFEVDGAIAARSFIESHESDATGWGGQRVQLVWDAIALHTERTIALFKELEVQVVSKGISLDFSGPMFNVPEDAYAAVGREFPKDDLKTTVNETIIWLCETKPATTFGRVSHGRYWL